MRKSRKLKKMIDSVIGFNVETPESNEGQHFQYVALKVTGVFTAKNGMDYIRGIAIKRLDSNRKPEFRQYQIERIQNRSIAVIGENDWTKTQPQLTRLGTHKIPAIVQSDESGAEPKSMDEMSKIVCQGLESTTTA